MGADLTSVVNISASDDQLSVIDDHHLKLDVTYFRMNVDLLCNWQ